MTQVVIVVPSDDVAFVRACALYLCAGVAHVTSVTRCGRFWFGEGVKICGSMSAVFGFLKYKNYSFVGSKKFLPSDFL